MQQHGDRPVRGGRPSLLAPEEQAAPERQGILSSLDGLNAPAAPARAAPVRSRRWAWGGAAAVGAVVVGGVLFLFADGEGDERRTQTLAAATPAETSVPASAPAAAPVAAPVAVAATGAAEPAAAVAPAPAASASASDAVPVASAPTGTVALAALPASAPAVVHDAAPAAMANPLAELAPPPRAEPHKAGAHDKTHDKAQDKGDTRRAADKHADDRRASDKRAADKHAEDRQAAQKRKSRPQDSDVVLLTALMSHIDPKTRKATPAEQLESCKRYNAAGEEQCRIRVCTAAGRKEPACKHVPAVAPET